VGCAGAGAAHWSKVIVELSQSGYDKLRAVELPLISLADDAELTRKMVAQNQGHVLLVGHSYGGAVITEMGNLPNVIGMVYIAASRPTWAKAPGRSARPNRLPPLPTLSQIATAICGPSLRNFMRVSARI
jgi:pimeloyl-ACP methyl ester carboxylesterase